MKAKEFFLKTDYPEYWKAKIREKRYSEGYEYRAIDLLQVTKGKRYLEVGVGEGRFIPRVSELGGDYIGVDISGEMLKTAKERNLDATLIVADAERLPFQDMVFEDVLCFATIFFIPDTLKAIEEMKRVSRQAIVIEFRNLLSPRLFFILLGYQILVHIRKSIRYLLKFQPVKTALLKTFQGSDKVKFYLSSDLVEPYYPTSFFGLKKLLSKVGLVISRIEAFDLNEIKLQKKKRSAKDNSRRNWMKPVLLVRAEKRIGIT